MLIQLKPALPFSGLISINAKSMCEVNSRFLELIDALAEVVSFQHHRVHGWKSASAGICRAKAGIMRRVRMAVLRETARHVTRGLDVVGPQCVQARIARRAQSSAAEADLDEFRAGIHNDLQTF